MFLAVEQEDLTRAIIAAIEAYARAHPGTTDEQVEDARLEVADNLRGSLRVFPGQFRDNSVSVAGQFGVSRLCRLAAPGMMKMELGFGSLWLEAGVG